MGKNIYNIHQPSAEPSGPDLTGHEQKQVKERGAPRAVVVYETVREEGEAELARPTKALAWSGLAAGLSMGFSLIAEGLIRAHLPATPWAILLAKFGYSAGFLIVVLGRQQLFTENTLTVILPLLQRFGKRTLFGVFRAWAVVLAANLVGAFAFAWVLSHHWIFDPEVHQAFSRIGQEAMVGSWFQIMLRGVFAAWLIAMMVWLLPAAESARIWVIVIMTYLVALGGFGHVIAGSIDQFYAILTGISTWRFYFGSWIVPTLVGNIIGGVSLVAVLGHAQVINETSSQSTQSTYFGS